MSTNINTPPEPEHEEDEQLNQKPYNKIEDAAFPTEFLDCMSETAFDAIMQYLKKIGASEDATNLLDVFYCLTMHHRWVIEKNGKVKRFENEAVMDFVAQASRLIVALGGSFHTTSGTTNARETDLSEKAQQQIENILQRSEKKPKRRGKS